MFRLLLAVLLLAGLALHVIAAEPKATPAVAVREALRLGAEGHNDQQRERLRSLLADQPDLAEARWHTGFVRVGKEWVNYQQVATQSERRDKLAAYERMRGAAAESLEGQLELANWCQKEGLADQERAHLGRALEFDPDHASTRGRLGFVRQGAEWISSREQNAARLRAAAQEQALAKWRPQVKAIVSGLSQRLGGSPADVRERAKLQLRLASLTDAGAVLALEQELETYLGSFAEQPGSEEHRIVDVVLPLIRSLGRIPHPSAAESLARIAVAMTLSVPVNQAEFPQPSNSVGDLRAPSFDELEALGPLANRMSKISAAVFRESVQQLRKRPRETYVPTLLASLSSPIYGQYQVYRERDGDVVLRLFYARETDDRKEGLESRTKFNPKGAEGGEKVRSSALSGMRASVQVTAAHLQLQQQNLGLLQQNLRITDVLRATTDQKLSTLPDGWWNWWNEENEVYVSADKPLVTRVVTQSVDVIAPPPPPAISVAARGSGAGSDSSSNDDRKKDCLTAGTLIWTATGHRPVEQLQVGDLVLSQHPETGELAYKPVLKTTVRPRGPLVRIQVGDETFRTSGGHPFWVVGEGWVRARLLKTGQRLYGVAGQATIEMVGTVSEMEPTYNLIVADFHTYFVGTSRTISHDNTVRKPSGMSVPGLPLGVNR